MIDRKHLENQLASLESQRKATEVQLAQIDGAIRMCRTMLGKLEREEDEAKAKDAETVAVESN